MRTRIEAAMRLAIREAFLAREEGENPFGAVLLDAQGTILHSAHSRARQSFDPSAHAEILVIREYCARTEQATLRDCIMVCSGEPCVMCSGAIKWAKIGRVYFSVPQAYFNKLSGGREKPSCDQIVNTGLTRIEVEGLILFEEGKQVFEGYQF